MTDDTSDTAIQKQFETIKKLKHNLNEKEKQLQDHSSTINALNSRIQELLKMNEALHLKNKEARNDIGKLIIEKNDAKNELMLHRRENMILNETVQELLKNSRKNEERSVPSQSSEYTCEEIFPEDISSYQQERTLEAKIKKLQFELHNLRAQSKQHEGNITTISSSGNEVPISRIHQLFHLFLGVTKFSRFSWV